MLLATMLAFFATAAYFVRSAKPRLEKIASDTLGMKVTCRSLHLSLLPISITADMVTIGNNDAQVAVIPTLQAHVDLQALLMGQLLIPVLSLEKPEFSFTGLGTSTLKVKTPAQEGNEGKEAVPFLLPNLIIRNARLVMHTDVNLLEIEGFDLTVHDLVLTGNEENLQLSRLSLKGDLTCRELRYNQTTIQDLSCDLQGSAGKFIFDPVSFKAFGGSATGKADADMTGSRPIASLQLQLSQFRAENFFTAMTKKEMLSGEMELTLNITTMGMERQEILRSLTGKVSMTGHALTAIGINLDDLLDKLTQEQQFDLVDLGSFLIVGPLGPTFTKAMDFGLLVNADYAGHTRIQQLISSWQINNGKAEARDVALATEHHRIAIKGGIDITSDHFRNLELAVVDAEGCAIIRQKINGSFTKPQIKKTSLIESAAAPLLHLLKGTSKLITGEQCEVFYNGSVTAPGN